MIGWIIFGIAAVIIFFSGIRIIRPVEVALKERFGKYIRTLNQGFNWVIPIIETTRYVNVTEQMVDVEPQTIITKDKLNVVIDAVVYYKIKDAKSSQYNIEDHQRQLTSLARTTLRAVTGKMDLTAINEKRDQINSEVEKVLDKETDSYGVSVLRVELQSVSPPKDVQAAMNDVVKSEQVKIAAANVANAAEIEADGTKRASIKEAEGERQSAILSAEGRAKATKMTADATAYRIKQENNAIKETFVGEVITARTLETTAVALKNGTKYVIDPKSKITNVMSDMSGITPIKK